MPRQNWIVLVTKEDKKISSTELHKILKEMKKYPKPKEEIRQSKSKLRQTIKKQREELLKQGYKESKENFLRHFPYLRCHYYLTHEEPPPYSV